MRLVVSMLVAPAAGLLAVAAVATVVPAPTRSLLPLSVAAPELSAILIVCAGALLVAAPFAARRLRRIVTPVAIASALLLARPLVGAVRTARAIEGTLDRTFGTESRSGVHPANAFRAAPFAIRGLFTGLPVAPEPLVADAVFASAAGIPLRVRTYRPVAGTAHPVVVQIYGGAWQHGSPADDPVPARYLASRGYVVFAVDYRHAPAFRWPAQLDDLRQALRWIDEHAAEFGADRTRMAVLGRSAGAHLALMLAYSGSAPAVRAVVSLYGPVDLIRGYEEVPRPDPLDVRATLTTFMGGAPAAMAEAYRLASPITYASRPQPPTLQIIGGRDHVVLPAFPARLDATLRAAGNRSVLIELPWADHAFDAVPFGPGAQIARYATERFLAATMR